MEDCLIASNRIDNILGELSDSRVYDKLIHKIMNMMKTSPSSGPENYEVTRAMEQDIRDGTFKHDTLLDGTLTFRYEEFDDKLAKKESSASVKGVDKWYSEPMKQLKLYIQQKQGAEHIEKAHREGKDEVKTSKLEQLEDASHVMSIIKHTTYEAAEGFMKEHLRMIQAEVHYQTQKKSNIKALSDAETKYKQVLDVSDQLQEYYDKLNNYNKLNNFTIPPSEDALEQNIMQCEAMYLTALQKKNRTGRRNI